MTQILAAPPFDFSAVEHWTLQKSHLPHKTLTPTNVRGRWENHNLENSSFPSIAFLHEGIADDRIGITTRMTKELARMGLTPPPGIVALRLKAPTVICYPPAVPHRSGTGPYCEKNRPGFAASRTIWIKILPDELLVHYCESEIDGIFSSHALQVKDPQLARLTSIYLEELQYLATEGDAVTKSLLLALMKRLRRCLADFPAQLSNSSWPEAPYRTTRPAEPVNERLCEQAVKYIDLHLQDALTWELLAEQLEVSPFYLNRVLRGATGLSVMRYVTARRIEAAKQMLTDRLERISDIAQLTGFSSLASFSNSFKRHAGCTPNEFRRRTNRNLSPERSEAA